MHHKASIIGNVKVTPFTPPPQTFRPLHASERELIAHGWPLPPDRDRFPAARTRRPRYGPLALECEPFVMPRYSASVGWL